MQPVRLGVIGAGLIWIRAHQAILASMPEAFVPVAFCEVDPERRAALARDFPQAQLLAEHERLLDLAEVDAVLVLTPLALNAPIALAALQAGKHVITEKPIARSVAQGQALIDAAGRAGRNLFVTEQMGYRQADRTLAEVISSGVIGDVVVWDRVQHLEADTAVGRLRYDSTAWRKQADYPLGTMFDGGIHLIASLAGVFGRPESVAAVGRKLRPEYGDYDQIAALFAYGHGVAGTLSFSSYLPPTRNHFHVHGTSGTITVERDQLVVELPGQPARTVALPAENPYVNMWRALAGAFAEGRDPAYTAEHALHDVALLEAIAQAIKTGRRVAVMHNSAD